VEKPPQGTEVCVIPHYVFDTGALISAERGKERARRFLNLVQLGSARILNFPNVSILSA
jgi:hypothetical protein